MDKKMYFISKDYLGGAGALCPLFLTKYLAKNGWDVQVVMAQSKAKIDQSLLADKPKRLELIQLLIWEWGLLGRILYMFHLIPCPDLNWVISLKPRIKNVFKEKRIIYTTLPQVSNALLAYYVKKQMGYPLCVDFRDEFYEVMINKRLFFEKPIYLKIESMIVKSADMITVTTETVKTNLVKRHGINERKVHVILNGFHEGAVSKARKQDKRFTFVYAGSLTAVQRPDVLIDAYRKMVQDYPEVEGNVLLKFYGWSNNYSKKKITNANDKYILYCGSLPHNKILGEIAAADVAFFSLASKVYAYATPTKLFEYVKLNTPILAAVPDGEATKLIKRYDVGEVADIKDIDSLAEKMYLLYSNKTRIREIKTNMKKHKYQFSSERQGEKLLNVLNKFITRGKF